MCEKQFGVSAYIDPRLWLKNSHTGGLRSTAEGLVRSASNRGTRH